LIITNYYDKYFYVEKLILVFVEDAVRYELDTLITALVYPFPVKTFKDAEYVTLEATDDTPNFLKISIFAIVVIF